MNKAQGRRASALKGYYAMQFARTQKNKKKNIERNEEIKRSKDANKGVRHPWHKERTK